eukprot:COSAG01_NODE_755_length_13819_cov_130.671939_6_plen_240_part_00
MYIKMSIQKKFNIAVIGLGMMVKSHLRVLQEIKEINLVSVCDTYAAEDLNEILYASLYEMLNNQEIDAAIISLPTGLHYEVVIKCLKNRVHFLIEKPVSSHREYRSAIDELSKKNNTKVVVSHIQRFSPVFNYLKYCVKDYEITRINIHRIGHFPQKITYSRSLTDLSVHDIDLITQELIESFYMAERVTYSNTKRNIQKKEPLKLELSSFINLVTNKVDYDYATVKDSLETLKIIEHV